MQREQTRESYVNSKLNLWFHAKCSANELEMYGFALPSVNHSSEIQCYHSCLISECVRVENQAVEQYQLKSGMVI